MLATLLAAVVGDVFVDWRVEDKPFWATVAENAEAVAAEVVEDLELLRSEEDGTVEVGSLPTVEADRDQLWQVFQNLVKNALEHSDDEPVTVRVSATETEGGYELTVADDCPGIDPHVQADVFQMFESGETTTPPTRRGGSASPSSNGSWTDTAATSASRPNRAKVQGSSSRYSSSP